MSNHVNPPIKGRGYNSSTEEASAGPGGPAAALPLAAALAGRHGAGAALGRTSALWTRPDPEDLVMTWGKNGKTHGNLWQSMVKSVFFFWMGKNPGKKYTWNTCEDPTLRFCEWCYLL